MLSLKQMKRGTVTLYELYYKEMLKAHAIFTDSLL